MRSNSNNWKHFSASKVVTIKPGSVPFVPGIGFILLGALIFLAPKFFLAAVAGFFIIVGAVCCYVAWKFMSFKKHVSKLADELHNSVDLRSFQAQNSDDIDITESDDKKIFFH